MPSWLKAPKTLVAALSVLTALGFVARFALWWLSDGSNDITSWYIFARWVRAHGLGATYLRWDLFNHPPLMGLLSELALQAAGWPVLRFSQWFKLPSILAEGVTGFLIYSAWRRRGKPLRGLAALAAYAMAFNCILISGYHGSTDALYFCFAFAAAYLMESHRAPFWSGLALGASMNVKIIPVLIALPLASRCSRPRDLARFIGGSSLGAIPFLVALVGFSEPQRVAFIRNVFMYRSYREYWGVELVLRWLFRWTHEAFPAFARGISEAAIWYSMAGGKLLLAASAGIAVWNFWLSKPLRQGGSGFGETHFDAYQLCAMGFALFLLFGPGFGVQYVGCVVPMLLATSVEFGALFATTSGIFIAAVYAHFVVRWSPIYSAHRSRPGSLSPLANIAWVSLALACAQIVIAAERVRRPRCAEAGDAPAPALPPKTD